jgi:hypothetical protein
MSKLVKKGKGTFVPVHAMTAYRGRKHMLLSFLTPALNGGEWSNSHPGRFTPGKEPQCHCPIKVKRMYDVEVQLHAYTL